MKKKVLWLIQSNQTTPVIIDFLQTMKVRTAQVLELIFIVPETASDLIEKAKSLNPVPFKIQTRTATDSYQAYLAKRKALGDAGFTDGLLFSDTLLLDDLGAGNVRQTILMIDLPENTHGLVLQVPMPLGSSEAEERIFHSAILWARENQIPVLGYELLPLDTRWTLTPSMVDGIVTRTFESYEYLKTRLSHKNIWLIPEYEASIFSSIATTFNLNGAKASYHYKNEYQIPAQRAVLYLPHNVAMIYEYQELIQILTPLGNKLHLMFSIGEDQRRGSYSQQETIETIYAGQLKSFASFSFHNINNPWEMMMADAIVAGSSCFNTELIKDIPAIIYDPGLPEITRGNKQKINSKQTLLSAVEAIIDFHQHRTDFANILMMMITHRK
ncbi:MAG: hypothetical protein KKE62_11460 [Proteobacteria bacterium]|nr:hypothetical protein [Pseudomonadota bacterium]MBU1388893.1 hypothetical protein [Pseudomonadota bacterium]MBU1543445.1 hypothetical protein [Pseudomonadota bacterium]MBU2480784.1 hypothetical protein [Pseudomonadota bacterium]